MNQLIRQSVENYDKSWREGMKWSYTQNDVTCSDGKTEVDVSEVRPMEGTPYEKLITKDGNPLSPEEQRKEDQKYEKELHKRQSESPEQRHARIAKYEKDREFVHEIPKAYDFKLVGDETIDGRPAWVVELTPRPGFVPSMPHGDLLKHIEGKLWIDKQDLQWARAEAHVKETVSIGLILARISPGAFITLDMDRISSALWVAHTININGSAKVLLVHNKNLDEKLTFSAYRPAGTRGSDDEVAHRKQSGPAPLAAR